MNGSDLAMMISKMGPVAYDVIDNLTEVWSREMTIEELREFCARGRGVYENYRKEVLARASATGAAHGDN